MLTDEELDPRGIRERMEAEDGYDPGFRICEASESDGRSCYRPATHQEESGEWYCEYHP